MTNCLYRITMIICVCVFREVCCPRLFAGDGAHSHHRQGGACFQLHTDSGPLPETLSSTQVCLMLIQVIYSCFSCTDARTRTHARTHAQRHTHRHTRTHTQTHTQTHIDMEYVYIRDLFAYAYKIKVTFHCSFSCVYNCATFTKRSLKCCRYLFVRLDGSMSIKKRAKIVEQFNNPSVSTIYS